MKLYNIIIALIAFNILVWGIVRLYKNEMSVLDEINKKIERVNENNKQILEMLK